MNRRRQRQFMLLLFLVVMIGLAVTLVLYALRQNINLFYTPSQLFQMKAPPHSVIRVGGLVVPGSIKRSEDGLSVAFKITDYHSEVQVFYRGILPDLFREKQGVVVKGTLFNQQQLKATDVLAKHDENYMPPDLKAALAEKAVSRQ